MIASVVLCITIAFSAAQAGCDEAGRIKNLKTQAKDLLAEISNFRENSKTGIIESFGKVSENFGVITDITYDWASLGDLSKRANACIATYQNVFKPAYHKLYVRGNIKCTEDALDIETSNLAAGREIQEESNHIISQLEHLELGCSKSELEVLEQNFKRINNQKKSFFRQVNNPATTKYRNCFSELAWKLNETKKNYEETTRRCIQNTGNQRG